MDKTNEVQKFFEDLPSTDKKPIDIFEKDETKKETVVPEKEADEEETDGRKNRHHRRLEEKLARSNEMQIALNERIKVLSEERQFRSQTAQEGLDPELVRVFGETDQGKQIAKIMQDREERLIEQAEGRARDAFREEQQRGVEEQRLYESQIDSQLEALEDNYNVDLTSNAPKSNKMRRELLELVQSLSPKDEEGNVTAYADFDAAFEVLQSRQTKQDASRQKEIAARGMENSSSSDTSKATDDATRNYLKSIGIRNI